jgi:hypothetical protein
VKTGNVNAIPQRVKLGAEGLAGFLYIACTPRRDRDRTDAKATTDPRLNLMLATKAMRFDRLRMPLVPAQEPRQALSSAAGLAGQAHLLAPTTLFAWKSARRAGWVGVGRGRPMTRQGATRGSDG